MGKYRKRYSEQQEEKIHRSLMENFDVDEKQLYRLWIAYMRLNADKNLKKKETINRLKKLKLLRGSYDYFLVLGLEIFTKKMIDLLGSTEEEICGSI